MLVKICGITRLVDAQVAVDCGAGALGFVFWPRSPRFIDPFRARAIAATLPPFVVPVGVFVDQDAEYVNAVAGLVPLGAVQLHGNEDVAFAATLTRPIVRAISSADPSIVDKWPDRVTLLFDADDPVRRGGTGTQADWRAAAALAAKRRLLLAGGLTPENVAAALAEVRPFGVDVSSGVERAPGIKDHDRLRAFIAALSDECSVPGAKERSR
jgi:phosphoribosylanthranilate isomerase